MSKSVGMAEEYEAAIARLRTRIDAADAAYRKGNVIKSAGADRMKADIISQGEDRNRRKG